MIHGLDVVPVEIRRKVAAERVFDRNVETMPDDERRALRDGDNSARIVCKDGMCVWGAIIYEWVGPELARLIIGVDASRDGKWKGPVGETAATIIRHKAEREGIELPSGVPLLDIAEELITRNERGELDTPSMVRHFLLTEEERKHGQTGTPGVGDGAEAE